MLWLPEGSGLLTAVAGKGELLAARFEIRGGVVSLLIPQTEVTRHSAALTKRFL